VDRIDGIPINHGVAASADGTRIYVSSEGDQELFVIDASTMEIIRSVELSARPNNIALTPDGSKVYVGIIVPPGAINVVDTETFEVKVLPHDGGIHNIYVTPDGKHVVAGSIAGTKATVIDTSTDEEVWAWEGNPIRPLAISAKLDGSTDKLYVQISGHHGFVVVDWDSREEVARVTLPDVPPEDRHPGTYNGAPAHGIGVSPDGETVWSTSRMNSHVYVYSPYPALELVASIPVGTDPDWVTFTPDGTRAFVANAISNDVSVIDMETYQEVGRIPVGEAPKRNTVITLP
jgi:YVTN family beta-propeller protein